MIAAGIYNRWVEQSFARLAALVPGRYAKEEQSIGLLGAIETFTYRRAGRGRAGRRRGRPAAEPEERRARGQAAKGPTIRLEVLAGAGFTITDAARVSPELRDRYLAAHRLSRARVVRARRRGARSRDGAGSRSLRIRTSISASRTRRTGRFAEAAASLERAVALSADSPDRARGARLDLSQAGRGSPMRARNTSKRSRCIPDFHLANETSRSSATCISATTAARCSTTRRTRRSCPTTRKSRSGSPTSRPARARREEPC